MTGNQLFRGGLAAALLLASGSAPASLDEATKAEIAEHAYETFDRLCASKTLAQRRAFADSDHGYAHYSDSDAEGEVVLEDTGFAERFPFRMTIRIGGDGRCQVAVWDDASALLQALARVHERALEERFGTADLGTALFRDREDYRTRAVYHYPLAGERRNEIVELYDLRSGWVVIGRYHHAPPIPYEAPTLVDWRKENDSPYAGGWDDNNATATYALGGTHIVIWESASDDWKMTLRTHLHEYEDPGQLEAVRAITLDGEPLAAFERCRDNPALCHTNASRFILDLRQSDMTELVNGGSLKIVVETRPGDTFAIRAPLETLSAAVTEAYLANHPEARQTALAGGAQGSPEPEPAPRPSRSRSSPEPTFDPDVYFSRGRVRECMERSLEVASLRERANEKHERLERWKSQLRSQKLEVESLAGQANSLVQEARYAQDDIRMFCGQGGYAYQMQCSEARYDLRLARSRHQAAVRRHREAQREYRREVRDFEADVEDQNRLAERVERGVRWLQRHCDTSRTGKKIFPPHMEEFCGFGADEEYPLCDQVD